MPDDTQVQEPKRKISLSDLKRSYRIFRFILPYKWVYILGMVFLSFSAVTSLSLPYLLSKLVDIANHKETWLIGRWHFGLLSLNSVVLILSCTVFLQALFSYGRVHTFYYVTTMAMADLRNSVYQRILMLPI